MRLCDDAIEVEYKNEEDMKELLKVTLESL